MLEGHPVECSPISSLSQIRNSKLLGHCHIPFCNPPQEFLIRLIQHDMKVLQRMHTLERRPVPEPNKAVPWNSILSTKGPLHKCLDRCSGSLSQIADSVIFFEPEFCPNHEVDNVEVNSVWPVVVEDLEVGGVLEGD
jgi:hypothetical protein